MIVETLTGRYTVVAQTDSLTADLTVMTDSLASAVSLLDAVELVGGALGHDRTFTADDITVISLFGQPRYRVTLTRAELLQFLQAEVLNYLDYTSLNRFHRQQKADPIS